MKRIAAQFVKYNLVGIVNTTIGFSIIFSLMFLGVSAVLSNALGYAIGSIVSYYLNKKYTFESNENSKTQAIKFFAVLAVSYLINFAVLKWLLEFMNPYLAQLISAVVYTLSSFLLAKFLVFKETIK